MPVSWPRQRDVGPSAVGRGDPPGVHLLRLQPVSAARYQLVGHRQRPDAVLTHTHQGPGKATHNARRRFIFSG